MSEADRATGTKFSWPLYGVLAGAAALIFGQFPAWAAYPRSAEGGRMAVATDNEEATRVAMKALRAGGNAVDAAIAATLTLGVVSPAASGLGGGGFVMVYSAATKKITVIDFRETAPAHLRPSDFERRPNESREELWQRRGYQIGVPGEPAGLQWLSTHLAKRALSVNAAPAAAIAKRGFPLGQHLRDVAEYYTAEIARVPALASLFVGPSGLFPAGTRIVRPHLARTLERLGREGAKPFYSGDIARKIVTAARQIGSPIDGDDLASYTVTEREPLVRTIDGRTIATMPAPSAGGLMLLEAASIFGIGERSELKSSGFGSSEYLHKVSEAMRGALADRARIASDPNVDPETEGRYDQALSTAQIEARRALIDPTHTRAMPEFNLHEHGTTHLVVADEAGNVVSLTTTINTGFGVKCVAGDTGILLNDELDDFTVASDIAQYGIGVGTNRPRPGARPVSSMMPTMVFENGRPILAVGGSGGRRIATGVTQAVLARLVFGLDPSASISSPRVHLGSQGELLIEQEIVEDVRAGLRAKGEREGTDQALNKGSQNAVQMMAIEWDRDGAPTFKAASDPRKVGFAMAN